MEVPEINRDVLGDGDSMEDVSYGSEPGGGRAEMKEEVQAEKGPALEIRKPPREQAKARKEVRDSPEELGGLLSLGTTRAQPLPTLKTSRCPGLGRRPHSAGHGSHTAIGRCLGAQGRSRDRRAQFGLESSTCAVGTGAELQTSSKRTAHRR